MTHAIVARVAPAWASRWNTLSAGSRMAVRAVVALVFLAVLAIGVSTPAVAADLGLTSGLRMGPVDTEAVDRFSDSSTNYLIVHRWSPVQFTPSGFLGLGSIATHGLYMVGALAVTVAVFLVRGFMQVVLLTSGGDLVGKTSAQIDEVFAKIGNGVLGNDAGTLLSGQGALIVSVLLLALIGLAAWRLVRGGVRAAAVTGAAGFAALALLLVMSSGAQQNVRSASSITASTAGKAVASPSWFISSGNTLSAWLGDQTQKVMTTMSGVLSQTETETLDECERYIGAIHDTYLERTGDTTAASVVVAFDDLLVATLWNNVRISAMGGATDSSNAAWCRYSEMDANVPAVDQVQMSRVAGLYSDIVGYDPAVAIYGNASAKSGSAVTSGGSWQDDGRELAGEVFGPTFTSGDVSSRAMYFWAACQWDQPGASVSTNPAWGQVKVSAASDDNFLEAMQGNSLLSVVSPALGLGSTLFDWLGENGSFLSDADACSTVVERGLVSSDSDDQLGSRAFQYGESYFLQDTLRVWNLSAQDHFTEAVNAGSTEAIDYYRSTQGLDSGDAAVGAIASTASAGVFVWMAFPISVGLLMAQVVGIVAWMLLPVALLALIVPVTQTKRAAMMAGRTIAFSLFAAVLFQFVLQLALFVYTLVSLILVPAESNSMTRWVLSTLAAVLAFFVVKMLVKSVFTNDLTTLRGAFRASTQIANRPLMSERGTADDHMGFRRPNWLQRASSTAGGMVMEKGREKAAAALLGRFGGGDPAESILDKDKTSAAGAAAGAPKTETEGAPGSGQRKPSDWRTATGEAVSSAARGVLGSAGARPQIPAGAQARGQYSVDPTKGTFTIPKEGTISAGGLFPTEEQVLANSLSQQEYLGLEPKERKAYTFDPVTGRFIAKTAVSGLSPDGVSKTVVAPLSALLNAQAPEGIAQADWDKTAAMRAQIAMTGLLDSAPERRSFFERAAEGARARASAAGTPLPGAPTLDALVSQAPGVASADGASPRRATALAHWPNGQVKEGRFEGDPHGLRAVAYREDGTVEKKTYARDGVTVERDFDRGGRAVGERWKDKNGNLHRADGPAQTEYDADGKATTRSWWSAGKMSRINGPAVERLDSAGAVAAQEFHLGGQQMSKDAFDAATAAAKAAVAGAGVVESARAVMAQIPLAAGPQHQAEAVAAGLAMLDRRQMDTALAEAVRSVSGGALGPAEGLTRESISSAVAASAQEALREAAAVRHATSGLDPQMMERQTLAALEQMSALDTAQQVAIAQQAARAILDHPEHFASATASTVERVQAAAQQVLDGQVNPAAAAGMVRLVNDSGDALTVVQMRQMMIEAAEHAGLLASSSRSTMAGDTMVQAVAQQVSAVPVVVPLEAAQQHALAAEAARVVLSNLDHYASATDLRSDVLAQEARAIVEGRSGDAQRLMRAVSERGVGDDADHYRQVLAAVDPNGGAMSRLQDEMGVAVERVASLARAQQTERAAAIAERFQREIQQMQADAASQVQAINANLVSQTIGGLAAADSPDYEVDMAEVYRSAFLRKTEVEDSVAARMAQVLDNIGIELFNAGTPDRDLGLLRDTRARVVEDVRRVKGVRSWFQH